MLIANGTVVTEDRVERCDVRIEGGVITELGQGLTPHDPAETLIDASDRLVTPGGVDVHTHMDLLVGTLRATDSFLTGTRAAACGGTTTIIDHMAFGPEGCGLQYQVDVYHALAEGNAVVDYGFHGVVDRVDDAILAEMEQLVREGITSFKFYLTYDRRLDDEAAIRLLDRARQLGALVCVHCENHAMLTWLRERFVAEGRLAPRYHPLSRPPACEAEAVFRVLSLAHVAQDAPVYIVHTSSSAALDAAAAVPPQRNAFFETCPQYLVLDDSRYELPGDEGLKYLMSPPLRKPADQEALWAALLDGRIGVVATDHCPFNFGGEKQLGKDDFTACPSGVPGVELRMPLMYSEGVVKRGMDLTRFVQLCCTEPARRFGVFPQKGTLAVGSDGDVLIFDPTKRVTVTHSMLHENVDYTPYEGMELYGYPEITISRGEVIARDGAFVGAPGRGRYLKRAILSS
ncbi:MAG: dihydropyrimidinase [Coriobacteriales bacterium]|jgi:dihydropyrimidinase|nr:dihydropyrimidinase [Coriobacteriales bacterium]